MQTEELKCAVPQEQFNIENVETNGKTNEVVDFLDEEASLHSESEDFDISDNEIDNDATNTGNIADFNNKTKSEIVTLFKSIIEERPVQSIRREAEAAKIAFYKVYRAEVEQLKKDFIANGGNEEDFATQADADEENFKIVFAEYRKSRNSYITDVEHVKEDNYKKKLQIIEELKELINSSETLNHTFNAFRELQARWKETGAVPQSQMKDIWETYHLHVENFYNFIKINNELRDLDLKKNTEIKLKLCEDAEALILEESAVSSFHKLQKFHEQWREIGPVSNEYKEQLWERFKEASSKINKRHQEYFEGIKDEQKKNLDLKGELCIKTEDLSLVELKNRDEWEKASNDLIEIQKIWKTIGFAPKKDNTQIYERFRSACDGFFAKKRAFYATLKDGMDTNLKAKIELCEMAEAIQNSTDWKKTSDELITLQKKWKEVGQVSRKHSDAIWKRFRKACDAFFNNKSEHFSKQDTQYDDNLTAKRALLEEIKSFEITDRESGFETLKGFQKRWIEIGFVPMKQKDKLQNEYREVIDAKFAKLKGDDKERKMDRFKDKVSSFKKGSFRNERERLIAKLRQCEADIALLENNIGFFAKSKNAESMIKDVRDKIEKSKVEMNTIIEKVMVLDNEEEKNN